MFCVRCSLVVVWVKLLWCMVVLKVISEGNGGRGDICMVGVLV